MAAMQILALVLMSLLAAGVAAQEPTLELAPSPLEVPARIGPLVGNPTPHEYGEPGMGVSYQYGAPGASLTVYVYDAGIADLEQGADTIPACVQFELAKQGVSQAYQQSRLLSEHLVKLLPPQAAPLMREAVFEFEHEGHGLVSYVWITAVAGQFIKLRFTADKEIQDELPDARRVILAAFGEAIQPHLSPADPEAKKSGTAINLDLNSLDGDFGTAGLLYPMLLSAVAEQTPDAAPVCGGEMVPSFETELGLYRTLFVDSGEGGGTAFGKRIARAATDGFLEELVWVELHRDSWGKRAPQELALEDYAKWKRKNLKRFRRPAFGSVYIDHPRPLAPEPTP